jgi:hypothetical protein
LGKACDRADGRRHSACQSAYSLILPVLGVMIIVAWVVPSCCAARHCWSRPPFQAVLVHFGHRQNGFFTAAALGGAQLIDDRPAIADVLIGLLASRN